MGSRCRKRRGRSNSWFRRETPREMGSTGDVPEDPAGQLRPAVLTTARQRQGRTPPGSTIGIGRIWTLPGGKGMRVSVIRYSAHEPFFLATARYSRVRIPTPRFSLTRLKRSDHPRISLMRHTSHRTPGIRCRPRPSWSGTLPRSPVWWVRYSGRAHGRAEQGSGDQNAAWGSHAAIVRRGSPPGARIGSWSELSLSRSTASPPV